MKRKKNEPNLEEANEKFRNTIIKFLKDMQTSTESFINTYEEKILKRYDVDLLPFIFIANKNLLAVIKKRIELIEK